MRHAFHLAQILRAQAPSLKVVFTARTQEHFPNDVVGKSPFEDSEFHSVRWSALEFFATAQSFRERSLRASTEQKTRRFRIFRIFRIFGFFQLGKVQNFPASPNPS